MASSRIAAAQAALANVQSSQDAEYAKKNQARRERAVQWADKEIRKLIAVLIKLGRNVTFGKLFGATVDDFEAISGTLVAAKKRDVVAYEGPVLLMQGSHDNVLIKLLKDTIPDTPLPPPEEKKAPVPKSHTKGLEGAASTGPEKCATCGKTVYMTERLGIAGKVYHSEGCFKCNQCNLVLRSDNFCSVNGKIWCQPHYTTMSLSLKGFISDTKAGSTPAAATSTPTPAAATPTPAPAPVVDNSAAVAAAAAAAEAKRQEDEEKKAAAAAAAAAAEEKKRFEAEKAKREAERARQRQQEEAAAKARADAEAAERKRRDDERKRAEEAERAKERAAEEAARVAAQQAKDEAERKRRADAETARRVQAEKERVAREQARKAEEEKLEAARRAREAEEKKKREAKEKAERDEEARLAKEEAVKIAAIQAQAAAAAKKAPAKAPPPVAAGSTVSNQALLAQGQALVATLQNHPSHPKNGGTATAPATVTPAGGPGRAAPTRPGGGASMAPATAASMIVKVPIKAGRTIGVIQPIALHLITYIEDFGLYETGLFRDCYAPAEVSVLNGLVEKYFVGPAAGKVLPPLEKYTMSTVAISLMQLLQSSEGIFPSKEYATLCQLQATQRGIGKMVVLSEMINELPTASFNFILPFLELLYHVHKNHEITQMTATDLAPLFLFAFIRPPAGAPPTAENEQRMTQLFIDILENYEQLEETTTLNDINAAMDEFLGDFPEFAPQPELVATGTTKMYNARAMY